MGIPSMTPYAHEPVYNSGVQKIIRVDSLGATQHHVRVRDIILAITAGTGSVTSLKRSASYAMTTSTYFPLLQQAWTLVQKAGIGIKVGNIFGGDLYYGPDENLIPALGKFGVLGVNMEVTGLYISVYQFDIEALATLTISDHCLIGEETTVEERQLTFNNMIELTLSAAVTA